MESSLEENEFILAHSSGLQFRQELEVTSTVKRGMNTHLFVTCGMLSSLVHGSEFQAQGMVTPTVGWILLHHLKSRQSLTNFSFQVTLDCGQLTTETNHHKWFVITDE